MAWEWSYSQEGLENIRENIEKMEVEDLVICLAEFKAYNEDCPGNFDGDRYDVAIENMDTFIKDHKGLTYVKELFARELYDKSEELRTCNNGGYAVWVCPFGCHTVSLDTIRE